jgi:hypothetical protein
MAVEYNQPVVGPEDSSDIYGRAAELKVVHHGGRQDASWLARADAMQVQSTNVLTSLISEAVKGFAAEKYPESCDCYLKALCQVEPGPIASHFGQFPIPKYAK